MTQIAATRAIAFEGNAITYRDAEDGHPCAYIMAAVTAIGEDGKTYYLPNSFSTDWDDMGGTTIRVHYDLQKARAIAEVVSKRGWIDGDVWMVSEAEDDLETRFADEACAEAEARFYGEA